MLKSLLPPLLAVIVLLFSIPTVFAQSGKVFRDYNANGTQDNGEPGVQGILVRSYANNTASSDGQIATTFTDATGAYALTGGSGTVRVEFTMPATNPLPSGPLAGLDFPGFRGAQNGTNVQFVASTATDVNFAINNPSDYCGTDTPSLVTSCFVAVNAAGTSSLGTRPVLVSIPYNVTENSKIITDYAEVKDVGSVWGTAYKRSTKQVFTAAFTKRHVGFGRGGPGAIYVTDISTGTGQTTEFFNFSTTAGTDMHTDVPTDQNPNNGNRLDSYDIPAFDAVGKTSLGDIDLSADEQTLYVVNLQNRKLYSLALATKDTVGYAIPNPGCRTGEHRPFAVKYYRGKVYVGVVCSNESATSPDDRDGIGATVYAFSNGTFTQVLTFPMTYTKVPTNADKQGVAQANLWRPWTSIYRADRDEDVVSYPQPWLTGIEFDTDGSMILGIRDRFGDQMGFKNRKPIAGDQSLVSAISPGGLLRAGLCGPSATVWTLENDGSVCGNPTSVVEQTNEEGPGGGRYYWGDRVQNGDNHGSSSMGGLAMLPGSGKLAVTALDPTDVFDTGGIKRMINATGAKDGNERGMDPNPAAGAILYTDDALGYGKANGLGGLQILCPTSPIEIGNRFWQDTDRDGIQDPDEPGIDGVSLQLFEGTSTTGNPISTVTTANGGQYLFNASTVTGGLKPNTVYTIRVATALQSGPLAAFNAFTSDNSTGSGSPGLANSKVSSTGILSLTTGGYGQNNFNYDMAVVSQTCALSATVTGTTCNSATGQYTLVGFISFTTPGATVTIQDGLATTTVSLTGSSPQSFTLTGSSLIADQNNHVLTVSTTDGSCSPAQVAYPAPAPCGGCTLNMLVPTLPAGAVGQPYSQSLATTGGSGTLTFGLLGGSLPAGLSLNTSTGLISGTPQSSATVSLTATVSDGGSCRASVPLNLVINALPVCGLNVVATAGLCTTVATGAGISSIFSSTVLVTLANPVAGTLIVTDGTSIQQAEVTTGSLTTAFVFPNLTADATNRTVTATLASCTTVSTTYQAPVPCLPVATNAALTLGKFVDITSEARIGSILTYTLVLTNTGTTVASTTVRDELGVGATFVPNSAVIPAGTSLLVGSPVSLWSVPSISPQQSLSLTFKVRVDSVGIIYNVATIPGVTATACTSIPVNVCTGDVFTFQLTAPAGRTSYRWYEATAGELTTQTGNTLLITAPGTYSLAVDNVTGLCPDFSCCPFVVRENPLPTFQAQAIPVTCVGGVLQTNGQLVIRNFPAGTTYQFSEGIEFNASASLSGAAATIPDNGLIASTLTNPTTTRSYTIRVYNGSGCYSDLTVTLTATDCGCPSGICTPFVIAQSRRSPLRR